jgi:hypothetical protein
MPRGRQHKNVDFINKLYEFSEIETRRGFAKACRKHQSAMTQYLNGTATPQKKVLRSCLTNLFGWRVNVLMEMRLVPELKTLPQTPGLYIFYDSAGNVLYIGKAKKLQAEVRQTLTRKIPVGIRINSKDTSVRKIKPKLLDLTKYVSLYEIDSPMVRHNLEVLMLRVFANQTHNSNTGKFK